VDLEAVDGVFWVAHRGVGNPWVEDFDVVREVREEVGEGFAFEGAAVSDQLVRGCDFWVWEVEADEAILSVVAPEVVVEGVVSERDIDIEETRVSSDDGGPEFLIWVIAGGFFSEFFEEDAADTDCDELGDSKPCEDEHRLFGGYYFFEERRYERFGQRDKVLEVFSVLEHMRGS
jgi:hypothetical protein